MKAKQWFSRQKLNRKITIMIGFILCIPTLIIYFMVFDAQKQRTVSQIQSDIQSTMELQYSMIQKTVELCNMSTQVFLNHQNLKAFLVQLKSGEHIETSDLVDFYKNDISTLERLVNSNPYLYQIHVYAENDTFSEMLPILYQKHRFFHLSWAQNYVSGEWQFDYKDTIFQEGAVRSSNHLMSLVTNISDFSWGQIGVLEVAVDMTQVFPLIFTPEEDTWSCFVDKYGKVYCKDETMESKWKPHQEEILASLGLSAAEGNSTEENSMERQSAEKIIGGEHVILSSVPIKELSGTLVQLTGIQKDMNEINRQRNQYLAVVLAAFLALLLLINRLVRALLKGFYGVLKTIRMVEEGDLNVRAESCGNDEIRELGDQVNAMLERIEGLIDENVARELLVKNSEIRALQNQINTHFIYNVLESIKMMAEINEEYAISDAITSLGSLLRYSMKWVSGNVTVGEEISYIQNYLELINLRFDYEIRLSLKIPEHIIAQEIPKMSLQPIIENAIYHGIEELAEDASIYMKGQDFGTYFTIEITDSGKGMTLEQLQRLEKKIAGEIDVGGGSGNGIGLKNVQDRIHMAFGPDYGISVQSKEGCYTKVIVKIPFTKTGGKMQNENIADR